MKLHFYEDAKNADNELRNEFKNITWNGPHKWVTILFILWSIFLIFSIASVNKQIIIPIWILIGVLVFGPLYVFWLKDYWLQKWNDKISKDSGNHKGSILEARMEIFENTLFKNQDFPNDKSEAIIDEKLMIIDRAIHETNVSKPKFRNWSSLVQILSLGGAVSFSLFSSIKFDLKLQEITASLKSPEAIKFWMSLLFLYLVFVGFFYVTKEVILDITNNQLNKVNRIILMLESIKSKLMKEKLKCKFQYS